MPSISCLPLALVHVVAIILLARPSSAIQGTTGASLYESAPYAACANKSALCFGLPQNCETAKNCKFLFRSHYDWAKSSFQFTMVAPSIQAESYIAVAFSTQSKMTGLVVQCYHASKSNQNPIQFSVNNGHKNTFIANRGDVTGFSSLQSVYENGQLLCRWNVEKNTKVHYQDMVFDFENNKYFIKLATGPVDSNGKIGYHDDDRLFSAAAISLKSVGPVHPSGSSLAVRWHASLMIFGWIGCVTVAILMARFTRDLWPEQKLFGQKHWFVFHRYLMIIGWLAIVASYIVIFVHSGGWTRTSAHSVIGMVSGILATLQIGNSFLRPAPDSPKRWIFDFGHWIIGNTAHILALANIINSGLKRSKSFLWLLLAYLFVYLLFSDLLKKLENRIGKLYSKRGPVILQIAVLFSVLVVVGITAALMIIMFTS